MKLEDTYFAHETAVLDAGCSIGAQTKIWHFSHIMSNAVIGVGCNIGQNVVVSPEVVLGNNVKVQNNVSIYTGVSCEDDVFLGPSMVFTNIMQSEECHCSKNTIQDYKSLQRCEYLRQCHGDLWQHHWSLFNGWCGCCRNQRSPALCIGRWQPFPSDRLGQ